MSHHAAQDPSDTPTSEVIVYRDGQEIHRQLVESEVEAAAIVAHWEEQPGVECEVVDLSIGTRENSTEVDWVETSADYPVGTYDSSAAAYEE